MPEQKERRTELWVAGAMIAKGIGLTDWVTPEQVQNAVDQIQTTGNQVVDLAEKLHGITQHDTSGYAYGIAALYILSRAAKKLIREWKGSGNESNIEKAD